MIRQPLHVVATMSVALTLVISLSCGQSATECDCVEPGARIHIPAENAAAVTGVTLVGTACQGVTPTCAQSAGTGCETYSFTPTSAGGCTVNVVFVDGTFTASVTFEETSGCCSGIYPSPTSAGDIDAVRSPSDAGIEG